MRLASYRYSDNLVKFIIVSLNTSFEWSTLFSLRFPAQILIPQ